MAIDKFIPTLWSARLHRQNERRYVYGSVTNRNWQGDIAGYGDTVKIGTIGDIDVDDYTKNETEISPQELDGDQQELVIDRSKYFAFKIDDIDVAQQRPKLMDEAMRKASRSLSAEMDEYLAGFHEDAGTKEDYDPIDIQNVSDFMGTVNQLLSEKDNDPAESRYIIVPPWLEKHIVASFQGNTQSSTVMNNGNVGRYYGLNVLVSNNVPTNDDGDHYVVAMTTRAVTLAEQILRVEAYRPENSFSDAVKGLHVYGAKTVEPDAMVRMTVTEDTSSG